ncbi:MAG: hypothetical protein R2745_02795 [Vicinamibacterales bacterium]
MPPRPAIAVAAVAVAVVVAAGLVARAAQAPRPLGRAAPAAPVYKSTLPSDDAAISAIAPAGDAVARVSEALARGAITLARRDDALGVLPAVLAALDVPVDSQMLVFSKTSVQAARISPDHPRAVYFGDDVMVAHVPGAPSIEAIAIDPARGPVFYTLTDRPGAPVAVTPHTSCLQCHHGPNTSGVPGIYVGSVIPGPTGAPLRDESAIITDHTSPFQDRWGGWYVTAARGEQPDRANAVASNPGDPSSLVREARQNLPSLFAFIDPRRYLAPTSDIVALMVFEHQTHTTNLLTRVAWQARLAAAGRAGRARELDGDLDDLVDALLLAGEAPLVEPVEGVSTFAATFQARGPRDADGRSLRDLDLRTRLFRYPLSYLIQGRQFAALPAEVRAGVYRRLLAVLTAPAPPARFRHLTPSLARDIRTIVRGTLPDLPREW